MGREHVVDDAAFLEAILADADNDTPRLVYADWLDERGDPRGEFIRVQCELEASRQDPRWPDSGLETQRHRALVERESRLLAFHDARWAASLRPLVEPGFRPRFRRGFVDWLHLPLGEFLAKADNIFQLIPLAGVELRIPPKDRIHALPAEGPESLRLIRELVYSPWMSRLRDLNLSSNGLDDRAVRTLAASPNIAGLRTLDLRGNNLTMAGVRALAGSKFLTSLRKLELSGNPRLPKRGRTAESSGGRAAYQLSELTEEVTGLFPPHVQIG
jgi:uncharacterized protein (TIGR02996 family)